MLISMTEKWQMAIDNGWTVGEVFIDGLWAIYLIDDSLLR